MVLRTEPLSSSALVRATYDDETQILSITFISGQTYDYDGVPPEIFEGLIMATSPGSYWHSQIKGIYG